MPIKAIIGRPRQGKSYSVVKNVLIPAWKAGRTIVTNIPLKGKAYEEYAEFIIYQPQVDYHNIVNGAIYVIDEIWLDFPAGITQAKLPEHLRHFLAMHAHTPNDKGLTTEIVILTQNLDQIATAVTALIETTYYVEKIKISEGVHKCRTNEYNGSVKGNPPKAKPEGSKVDAYEPEVFEYYKSHTGAKTDEGILEMDAIKSTTLFDKKIVKYGLPFAVIAFPVLIYTAYQQLGSLFAGNEPEEHTQPEQPNKKIQQRINTKQLANNETQSIPKIKKDNDEKIEILQEKYDYFDELNAFPLAKDKRITGVYKYHFNGYKKHGVQLTIQNQQTLDIPMQNVRIDGYGEYFLVYRNEIVTRFTGEPPKQEYAFLPDGEPAPKPDTEQFNQDNLKIRGE